MSKTPQRIEAEKLCRAMPGAASRTLAKKLSDSHSITVEQARGLIRSARGNSGVASRKNAPVPRPNGHAGTKPAMPPSLVEPYLDFELGNGIKVASLSDLHIPYHCPISLPAAVKYCKARKPDVLLINGDGGDFYSASRHQTDPSKRDMPGEMKAIRAGLAWLRGQFQKARFVYKVGNHEERWQHWLWNNAPLISNCERMSLAAWLDVDKYGVELVSDRRPVTAGKLPIMHGHELGRGISSPVNAARGVFMKTGSSMLIGDCHRTSQHTEPDFRHKEITCWSQGCLCDLSPHWLRVNKWNNGFCFITVNDDGRFHVDNLRISTDGDIW